MTTQSISMTKTGLYTVAGRSYTNKFTAFEYALCNGWWPHWDYYEKEFSAIDWTVEPEKDIVTLYKERALQIRQKYDYVTLWYSGGSDSHTIAQAFFDNTIFLDEVLHRTSLRHHTRTDKRRDAANLFNESRYVTFPFMQEFERKSPGTKFRIWDAMEESIEFWETGSINFTETNFYYPTSPFKHFTDQLNSVRSPRNIAKIAGLDKPRVFIKDGKWYFAFFDIPVTNQMTINRGYDDPHDVDVPFYWHPDAAQLLIKQGHLIMKWFKAHPQYLHLATQFPTSEEKTLYDEIIKKIVYPGWDLNTFQVEKPPNDIGTPEFEWFWKNTEHIAVKNWLKTARTYSEEVRALRDKSITINSKESIKERKGGWWQLPGCWSRLYPLEK